MRYVNVLASGLLAMAAACTTAPDTAAPPDDFVLPPTSVALATASPAESTFAAASAESLPSAQACKDEFLAERRPVMVRKPAASDVTELCFTHFAVLHSASRLGPLWSAYRLTRKMSQDGDAFSGTRPGYHKEDKLTPERQAKSSDFDSNPYDVGHMTPNNDMPEASSQFDSFSMANMSPQYDTLNRVRWRAVERTVHELAQTSGEIYIVTGPIYAVHPPLMNNRVPIPDAFFKAVYDVSRSKAIAFVFENTPDSDCELLSIADLQGRAGVKPFPSLSKAAREDSGEWTVPAICDDD